MSSHGWLASPPARHLAGVRQVLIQTAGFAQARVVPEGLVDAHRSLRRATLRALHILGLAGLVGVVCVAGGLTGLRLAGPSEHMTRLGEASLRVGAASHGKLAVMIPHSDRPIRLTAFHAPVSLQVVPRKLDRPALIRAASGRKSELTAVSRDVESVARRALRRAWLWMATGALALGVVAALVVSRVGRTSKLVIIALALGPGACAALAGGVSLARVDATFDPSAFQRASFYRSLADQAQLPAFRVDPNLVATEGLGQDWRGQLKAAVRKAIDRGAIGVPPVTAGEQLPVNDDRLEEAITALGD